jgi:hypothetical protein
MRPSRRHARAALSSFSLALTFALGACNSHERVFPAFTCADPCCGGPYGIDCAEHPDIACVEPADACGTIAYGCVKGSVYIDASIPFECTSDATPIFTEPDAADTSDGTTGADAIAPDAATDAPGDEAGAIDATLADAAPADAATD